MNNNELYAFLIFLLALAAMAFFSIDTSSYSFDEEGYSIIHGERSFLETNLGLPPGTVKNVEAHCGSVGPDIDKEAFSCHVTVYGWVSFNGDQSIEEYCNNSICTEIVTSYQESFQ